jgi:hypothetical protein
MVHVTRLATSCEIWNSLAVIHDTKDYRIAIAIQRALFRQSVSDGGDMVEHLTQLKHQWERLNVLDDRDFHITDKQFKTIIASSLPETWDIFTEPYIGGRIGTVESDPKKLMSSQECIGILKEEYIRRKNRGETTQYAHYTNTGNNNRSPRPLANRIQNPKMASTGMFCNNCQQTSHITDDCKWLGKPRCGKCTWFGHMDSDCRRGQKRKNVWGGGQKKKSREERTYTATEGGTGEPEIVFVATDEPDTSNHTYNPLDVEGNNSALSLYDWLADSATTSHITNMRNAYTTFESLEKPVSGVGNAQTCAKGKGTINIRTMVNHQAYNLTLRDVLYIPSNPHNLISLGRWDNAGGNYHGGQGILTMNARNGKTVAVGTKINNNLYKLKDFTVQHLGTTIPKPLTTSSYSFNVVNPGRCTTLCRTVRF